MDTSPEFDHDDLKKEIFSFLVETGIFRSILDSVPYSNICQDVIQIESRCPKVIHG